MAAIDHLRQLVDAWQNRPQLIEQARQEGVTWQVIADALHMTRMGVVKLHATLKEERSESVWTATCTARIDGDFTGTGTADGRLPTTLADQPTSGTRVEGSFTVTGKPPVEGMRFVSDGSLNVTGDHS